MKSLITSLLFITLLFGAAVPDTSAQQTRMELRSFGDSLGYTFGWRFATSLKEQNVPANYAIVVAGFTDVFEQGAPLLSETEIMRAMHRASERQQEIQARVESGDTAFDFGRALYGTVSKNPPERIRTWNDTMSYLLGKEYGESMRSRHKDISAFAFAAAVEDFFAERMPLIDGQGELEVNLQLQSRREESKSKNSVDFEAEIEFLRSKAALDNVVSMPSGIMYEVIKEGTGEIPQPDAILTLHFISSFIDGKPFLNTWDENQPMELTIDEADPNWVDILRMMRVGSTYRLYIPPDIGYARAPSDMPKRVLIYEMHLLEASDSDFSLDDI